MRILGVWCGTGENYVAIGRLFINRLGRDCQWWWRPWTTKNDGGRTLFWGRLAITIERR